MKLRDTQRAYRLAAIRKEARQDLADSACWTCPTLVPNADRALCAIQTGLRSFPLRGVVPLR